VSNLELINTVGCAVRVTRGERRGRRGKVIELREWPYRVKVRGDNGDEFCINTSDLCMDIAQERKSDA
jgi:hypothetical protein